MWEKQDGEESDEKSSEAIERRTFHIRTFFKVLMDPFRRPLWYRRLDFPLVPIFFA